MAEDEGEEYVSVFSKYQLDKQVKVLWEEYSKVQWQIDLVKEMEACPQPSLSLPSASGEAAV